ncbi:MAG: hypothetical protein ACHQ9S_07405 [Candidatus Binatia bacterium]
MKQIGDKAIAQQWRAPGLPMPARCTAVIEDFIRRYREASVWFHTRWKTRPPGEPRLYE